MPSCLICDDHGLLREALAGTVRMVWPQARILMAAEFPTAWALAREAPDLCLADLVMPGADPLAGIEGLRAAAPHMPVLVITGTEDDALMLALLRLGVAGFVPKSVSGPVIEAAIRLVLAGGTYLPQRVAELAAAHPASGWVTTGRSTAPEPPPPARGEDAAARRFTDRQIDVLRLVAQGQSNKEIGKQLGLAPSTVKSHLENACVMLGVSTRTEASLRARALGVI